MSANLAQAIQQVLSWGQQLQGMTQQYTQLVQSYQQLQSTYNSLTGPRGMQNLLSVSLAQSQLLAGQLFPDDGCHQRHQHRVSRAIQSGADEHSNQRDPEHSGCQRPFAPGAAVRAAIAPGGGDLEHALAAKPGERQQQLQQCADPDRRPWEHGRYQSQRGS